MHAARVPSQDEVLQAFRRAGVSSPSPLQARLIPLLLKGRDAIAEVASPTEVSTAIAAALALGLRGAGPSLRALVLLPGSEEVGEVTRTFARFARTVREAPSLVPLGAPEEGRREQRRLEREATVVAGTPGRVIDHIRRGSLSFADLQMVVIREPAPETRADFAKDVQFIVAKWTERPRVVLLARGPLGPEDELAQMLHHPTTMEGEAGGSGAVSPSRVSVLVPPGTPVESLARVVLGLRLPPLVAIHGQKTDAAGVALGLRAHGLRTAVLPPNGRPGRREALLAFTRRALDVLFVPFAGASASDLEEAAASQVVFVDPPPGSLRVSAGMLGRASILVMGERESTVAKLQEALGVSLERNDMPDDDALLEGAIDRVVTRMKGEDPEELARLRARIRRRVPFLQRPLFMASLLKSLLPQPSVTAPRGGPAGRGRGPASPAPVAEVPGRGQRGRFGRSDSAGPSRTTPRPGPAGPTPVSGDSAQLFVSVGRNRRVYARELTELFTRELELASGDIRDVRVFDKYSFVDIAPGKAEQAIRQLNGREVKGRPITVNYAKKKEENKAT